MFAVVMKIKKSRNIFTQAKGTCMCIKFKFFFAFLYLDCVLLNDLLAGAKHCTMLLVYHFLFVKVYC